jgi:Domain of unknown function (DUF4124)
MWTSPRQVRFLAGLAALLSLPVVSSPSLAAPLKQEEVYRCRDAKGQSYFGQNIPPECMDADVEVLDGSGRVVRVIPGKVRARSGGRTEERRGSRQGRRAA